MNKADYKFLRKAAFVIAFGATVGKCVGMFVSTAVDTVATKILQHEADGGNSIMRKAFDSNGLDYKTDEDETE